MPVVRMTHDRHGELLVPDRKVATYKTLGWRVVQPNKKSKED